jgi:lactoylglutathione lyase
MSAAAHDEGEPMAVISVMPNLYTTDMERAVAFYRDVLGGTQTFSNATDGPAEHVELRLGDVTIALSSRDAVLRDGLPMPSAGHPMELVLWCDSVDEMVEVARAAGAAIVQEPQSGHVSGHRRAYVADPEGNWLALVSTHNE